jgi:crotonobetainyl-CoA:carnitine CoA-transferase CaiB-like acyl-CoA transferase
VEWAALCSAIDRPDLVDDAQFASEPARQAHQAEMRVALEAWTTRFSKRDAMDRLQAAGVRAGAVLTGADMLEDPQLRAPGYYQAVEHPSAGRQTMRVAPYHMSDTPPAIRKPAPKLGQHTESVLRELLDLSDADLQSLSDAHVTDDVPLRFQSI